MQQVLVLNASYEPLNVTTVRRAHVLVFKGKAEVIEELDEPLRSATVAFPRPNVIRLVQYVRVPRTLQRKISRRALFARDGWRCSVPACGSRRNLHDHHVIFRSRGGDNARDNRVTVCVGHHLHGIHEGRVRAWGEAPAGMRWELGVRSEGPPLLRFVGERYDDCSRSK